MRKRLIVKCVRCSTKAVGFPPPTLVGVSPLTLILTPFCRYLLGLTPVKSPVEPADNGFYGLLPGI